jgi:hypothetical protein
MRKTTTTKECKMCKIKMSLPFWLSKKTDFCSYKCSGKFSWTLEIKNRDNWKCRISNNDCKGHLESHHILNWVDYPELRYDINNGITLYVAHHPRKWAEEKRLSPYFMELVSVSKE